MIDIACCLFRSKNRPGAAGSKGWNLYSPADVARLYRGFERNLTVPFTFYCVTDFDPKNFEDPIKPIPFAMPAHVGEWMCINELLRPDFGEHDRRLVTGLDTVIMKNVDELTTYAGPVAMTLARVHADKDKYCNAVMVFSVEKMKHLWENYVVDPEGVSKRSTAWWSKGMGSEMVYWRDECQHEIDCLDELFPDTPLMSWSLDHLRGKRDINDAAIVYFHGSTKPHNVDHPLVKANWV